MNNFASKLESLPLWIILTFSLSSLALAQPGVRAEVAGGAIPAQFDAADVHVSAPGTNQNGFINAGRVEFRAISMMDLITVAYNVESNMVAGGPTWIAADHFDITATAPRITPDDQLRVMLQNLLTERFGLTIHREDRPSPIYALTLGKSKHKMKESSASAAGSGCGPNQNPGAAGGLNLVSCQGVTMDQLVGRLRGMAGAYLDHPVVNKTGLEGGFDFTVKWTSRGQLRKPSDPDYDPATSISIFDAMDKQLGLKLEAQTQMSSAIIVDRVNEQPTENKAGTVVDARVFPAEFEVASVKPVQPGVPTPQNARILPSGQVELAGFSLKDLITLSYDIPDDRMVSDQKWLESDKFNLVAKTESGVPLDALRTMMQRLLADQFKLKVHNDQRPVNVYVLAAGPQRAKLTESSGNSRSECKVSVVDGARTLTCTNTTMKQFAEQIHDAAGAYFDHSILDMTGLHGAYDFAVTWAPKGRIDANNRLPSSDGAAAPPTSDLTVFQGVEKYLGLKITLQKQVMPVLVVDHIEHLPQ